MKSDKVKFGQIVVDKFKLVGIVTNVCEKEKNFTVLYSDGSARCFEFSDTDEFESLGPDRNKAVPILLSTLQTIERLHNE